MRLIICASFEIIIIKTLFSQLLSLKKQEFYLLKIYSTWFTLKSRLVAEYLFATIYFFPRDDRIFPRSKYMKQKLRISWIFIFCYMRCRLKKRDVCRVEGWAILLSKRRRAVSCPITFDIATPVVAISGSSLCFVNIAIAYSRC